MRRSKCAPGFLRWYDALSRRDKVRYRVGVRGNQWDEWLVDRPNWLSDRDFLYYYDGGWSRLVCLFLGHDPVPDHCMIPDHDYCSTCGKRTPGEAHR